MVGPGGPPDGHGDDDHHHHWLIIQFSVWNKFWKDGETLFSIHSGLSKCCGLCLVLICLYTSWYGNFWDSNFLRLFERCMLICLSYHVVRLFCCCEIIDRTWWFLNWFEFLGLCFWEQGETELNEFQERVSKLFKRRVLSPLIYILVIAVFVLNYISPFCFSLLFISSTLFKTHEHILKESSSWRIFLRLKGNVKCLFFPSSNYLERSHGCRIYSVRNRRWIRMKTANTTLIIPSINWFANESYNN